MNGDVRARVVTDAKTKCPLCGAPGYEAFVSLICPTRGCPNFDEKCPQPEAPKPKLDFGPFFPGYWCVP